MPIYEYRCTKCRSLFEVLQKVHDPPLNKCIKCGGKVVKAVSAPAIQFKGNGWYITDYADKTKKPPAQKKQPSAKTPEKSDPEKTKEVKKE